MADDDYERRREERERAAFEADTKARIAVLEREMSHLSQTVSNIDHVVTVQDGKMDRLAGDVKLCRDEVAKAAEQIQQGKDDAVEDLKETISAANTAKSVMRVTKFQVFVGGIVALAVTAAGSLITLAFAGQLG